MKRNNLILSLLMLAFFSCQTTKEETRNTNLVEETLEVATQQIGWQVKLIEDSGKLLIPRTVYNGVIEYIPIDDWTSGFFPGTLWYLYDLTGDNKWIDYGTKYTENLDSIKHLKWHHDIGFMINCSYGNAYRVTQNPAYKEVMIEAAKSLSTRYRPIPGVIQSWDEDRGWQAQRGWMCPVIIDNMMNLELLFEATRFTGDSTYYHMAVSHADNTLKYHFREDYSTYHVVDYDKQKGGARNYHTAQGYAHESAWARGQGWALYGFALCYRETNDPRYLEICRNIYNFLFQHPNMPADLVPYWDFDAPNIPHEPRDASAAAVIASAMYELAGYDNFHPYKETADKIVNTLCSDAYRALIGTNGNFVLMHSVGSIPHGSEIDVPLNYADYYFLEAIKRKLNLEK